MNPYKYGTQVSLEKENLFGLRISMCVGTDGYHKGLGIGAGLSPPFHSGPLFTGSQRRCFNKSRQKVVSARAEEKEMERVIQLNV